MTKKSMLKLDIVVPLYNDEEVVEKLCETVFSTLENTFKAVRLIMIDDGSVDESYNLALRMRETYDGIEVIKLAGNFGQHRAILAGLRSTSADLVAVMDSDLQDRPEHIPLLVERMLEDGTSLAIARRTRRADTLRKRLFSRMFAAPHQSSRSIQGRTHLGAFRVMRQGVVKQICDVKEHTGTPFSMLYSLRVPYSTVDVDVGKDSRRTGYTFKKSSNLPAIE